MSNYDLTSILDSQNQMTSLLEMYMTLEEQPKLALQDKQYDLEEKDQVLSDLDSNLTALRSKAERLTDPITNYFEAKIATGSDKEKFTVEAANSSSLGNHTLTVERLARSDTRVSEQINDDDSDFTSYTEAQTFSIEVGSPTDEDSDNRVSISVTVDAFNLSLDNETVLYSIASAINDSMSRAVTDEDIESDEIIRATVVKEIDGTSRLQLRSNLSGYTNRMSFTDSADGLLNDLEINKNVAQSGSKGGYMIDVGTDKETSELNSKFVLDGLTFYRDTNTVSDAAEGVTVNFLSTFSTTETITVNADTEAVMTEVNEFIDTYNAALLFLEDNAQLNTSTYQRGILADDTTYRNMKNEIRSMILSSVEGVTNTSYSYLNSIGIEADSNGYISLSDVDEFTEALENNSSYVYDLFREEDNGLAVRLESYLEKYVKANGTISKSQKLIDERMLTLNDRIDVIDTFLDRRRQQLQTELEQLQESMAILSSQQNFFSTYMNNM
ncbi:MAG: flagellar filament capping protein FliD [Candidatus Marinimicrobia bacterium]|nr:flagellar filament capping protein FliD [Candidatus Neomarinimicrobiota bacterium]